MLQAGIDPGALRKSEKAKAAHDAVNTLEAVARAWLAHQSGRWEPITLHRITASLETYIFKSLGNRPVASVKPGEIMAAVKRIEEAGAGDQAGRVLQRVKSIHRWAVNHERIDANPMIDLVPSDSDASPSTTSPTTDMPVTRWRRRCLRTGSTWLVAASSTTVREES